MAQGIADKVWSIGDLLDAALATQPIDPVVTAADRRRAFRVIEGGAGLIRDRFRDRAGAIIAHVRVRVVSSGAHFKLAIEFDRISLQRNAKRNQLVSVRMFHFGAGVLFVSAGVLPVSVGMLLPSAGVLLVGAGMLNLSTIKTIFRPLREPLDGVLKHFLYNTHFVHPFCAVARLCACSLTEA